MVNKHGGRAYPANQLKQARKAQFRHVGECATDETARQVCEGIYADRVNDNLALCEALRAVYALTGENKEIKKIVHDAIRQHGIDDA